MKYILLLLTLSLCKAYDITIGLGNCPSCPNYHKVIGGNAQPTLQNAANIVRSKGGGNINILAGTYILYKQVEFYSNTAVKGAGMDRTILKLKDYASPWKVGGNTNSGFFRAAYKSANKCINLSFSGFTLDGNKARQNKDANSKYGRYGIFTEGCTNVVFNGIKVRNFQGYGFDPHGWKTKHIYGKNLKITNCIADNNDWDGFTLDQTNGITFLNNQAINNGRHGINVVTGSRNVVISGSKTTHNGYYYYTGSGGCGITIQNNQLYGTNNIVVQNSIISNDQKGGICTDDVFNIKINANKIYTPQTCIKLTKSRTITISNNYCSSTKKSFITNKGSNGITQFNNHLSW
jgi:parallel beta-helix repeat protein